MPVISADMVPSLVLVAAWFLLLRALRYTGYGIAFLSLAGTVLHEASHYFVGLVLGAKPQSVSLLPKKSGDYWVLGSVSFTGLNLLNAAFVAFAPLSLLGVAWLVFLGWIMPAYQDSAYLSWFLGGYVAACALFACIPSVTDIKVGAASALMYGGIGYLVWAGVQ